MATQPPAGVRASATGSEALAVVVVTHNSSEHLPTLLGSLLAQLRDGDELVIVDNASADDSAERARSFGAGVRVLSQAENLGFCEGCNVGASSTAAPLLLFLNPDAAPSSDLLERLRRGSATHPEWAAWQATVLLEDGRVNSSGGVVHYLGIGWAGDCGQPLAALPAGDREVAFPSGAAMVIRRSAWKALGGFDREYFMYGEDLDLGLRLWLGGMRVGRLADARVTHGYDFHKGAFKWFALERNRWCTVLSTYPPTLLALVLPALLALEPVLLAVAARDGWLPAKLRAHAAVISGLPRIIARRRRVQQARRIGSRDFASHLTASLDSPYIPRGRNPLFAAPQAAYLRLVRALLAVGRPLRPEPTGAAPAQDDASGAPASAARR